MSTTCSEVVRRVVHVRNRPTCVAFYTSQAAKVFKLIISSGVSTQAYTTKMPQTDRRAVLRGPRAR
eukprot:CAMPEP_0170407192 /NCGR_PEP_ID=MMETSP0117_2-20130122/28117_1 /TAXON_ID=400756 /ORGANISM="Durinskia baltica, Strain CSIRO CS-38" /LENGTH=65 /DNA_ID=CAMNT_0010664425 /DNA_START=377 /DNA_END=574 /DNA_ORIENTATION=+